MFLFRCLTTIFAALLLALPAAAWNYSGHCIVAEIAYERLTPQARARVDRMIREHPDYNGVFTKDAPGVTKDDAAELARYAFVYAAGWPDLMTELPRLLTEIAAANPVQAAYDLPWVEHLIGEIHQPLHATSRFLKSQPKGDAGGTLVIVQPGRTLHSLWDDAAAPRDLSYDDIVRYAREITADYPGGTLVSLDPTHWAAESFELDKSAVYTFGLETGSKEHPLALPDHYEEKANHIARQRVALAGYRLAGALNKYLR